MVNLAFAAIILLTAAGVTGGYYAVRRLGLDASEGAASFALLVVPPLLGFGLGMGLFVLAAS